MVGELCLIQCRINRRFNHICQAHVGTGTCTETNVKRTATKSGNRHIFAVSIYLYHDSAVNLVTKDQKPYQYIVVGDGGTGIED